MLKNIKLCNLKKNKQFKKKIKIKNKNKLGLSFCIKMGVLFHQQSWFVCMVKIPNFYLVKWFIDFFDFEWQSQLTLQHNYGKQMTKCSGLSHKMIVKCLHDCHNAFFYTYLVQ